MKKKDLARFMFDGQSGEQAQPASELRQIDLYNYLLGHRSRWTSMYQVAIDMSYVHPEDDGRGFHNSSARRRLTQDIADINASRTYAGIIIHGDKGVKIADEREEKEFIAARHLEITSMIRALDGLCAKIGEKMEPFIYG